MIGVHGSSFYKMFRPEFVMYYSRPLSSDCFTGWGKINKDKYNSVAIEATNYLYNNVIPKFANEIVSSFSSDDHLIEVLHRAGINVRHLGCIYE